MITGENIKKLRQKKNLSVVALAEKLGVHHSTLYRYEKGAIEKIPANLLEKIAEELEVSPTELLGLSDTNNLTGDITTKITQLDSKRQQDILKYAEKQLKEQQEEETSNAVLELYNVETVTKLSAGRGYSYDDYETKTVQVTIKPPRCDLASLVTGDSMFPDYKDGDVVFLVDKGISTYNGQVCAVAVDDETYIKKVYTDKYGLRLVSINPIYDDIYIDFPPDEDTHIKIYEVVGSAKVVR